jgi:hypothetical protein
MMRRGIEFFAGKIHRTFFQPKGAGHTTRCEFIPAPARDVPQAE